MIKASQNFSKKITQNLLRRFSDNFLSGNNALYAEQMYSIWINDKKAVHSSWDAYFSNISKNVPSNQAFISPEELSKSGVSIDRSSLIRGNNQNFFLSKAIMMIDEFRTKGHYIADLDPLKLTVGVIKQVVDSETINVAKDISESEYDTPIDLSSLGDIGFHTQKKTWTLREISERLNQIYCGKIAFQYSHISDNNVTDWIKARVEKFPIFQKTKEQKLNLLDRILESQSFNAFCERKYSTYKRFGCEGLDSSISGISKLIESAAQHQVKEIVTGMAHRGRLNMLCCVFKKPYTQIFAEFEDVKYNDEFSNTYKFSGDVKYHLSASNKLKFDENEIVVNLLPNPSHLEAVYPVTIGCSKGRQTKYNDSKGEKVLPIVIHGDAALAGQGVIYETQQMEKLNSFYVGGAIHIVANNQIGFTTNQIDGRSNHHPTSIAKMNNNFVIHVNADYPEEVDFAMELAIDYRMKFLSDVYINLVGYRRPGHNEQDNAEFTQPEMYHKIQKHPSMHLIYRDQLEKEGVITREEFETKFNAFFEQMEKEHAKTISGKIDKNVWDPYGWDQVMSNKIIKTGISKDKFMELGHKINSIPDDFNANKTIRKIYSDRMASINNGKDIDWATAEALAYASIMDQKHSLRISGEDVQRGTFSHRHAVIHDMQNFKTYTPIRNAIENQSDVKFDIENSLLSEYAVLGFEYGHSLALPNDLTIWEAQFGDFVNGAQIIVDQYILTGEKKWLKKSNLVLLLPHGYDGQGPEHSNARLERFLMNIADDLTLFQKNKEMRTKQSEKTNAIILNITNPANFFHAIRRQVSTSLRKPVVIFSPKRLLKHKLVRSDISEFMENTEFIRIYDDDSVDKKNVRLILFCSGQIYFDLLEHKLKNKIEDVAIIRMEQLAPFPYNTFAKLMSDYNKNATLRWVSEEHRNFGAYSYIKPRMNIILKELDFQKIDYAGRDISATTATGSIKQHRAEIEQLLKDSFE